MCFAIFNGFCHAKIQKNIDITKKSPITTNHHQELFVYLLLLLWGCALKYTSCSLLVLL